MRPVPVLPVEEAAALIPDDAVVTVSSSSGLGCPDHVLGAVGARFASSGSPRGLTLLHPIAAGDMYGIKGVDHLAQPGLIRRIIAGSYPSGPSALQPPAIWALIEQDQVEAYNLPSGVLFQMHRQAAVGAPGVLTDVGIDTFVDPRREGGRMNAAAVASLVELVEFDGATWLYFRAIPVDVAIIRATTADEHGNLTCEDEGAVLGVLDQALAARRNGGAVIAQVKRVAAGGALPPQQVRVPGILVDAIVVAPEQLQTTQTSYQPEISGTVRCPIGSLDAVPWGTEKVIARRAALALRDGDVVNLGFGLAALVPRILIEEGLAGAVTWVIEQGAIGGVPLTGFQFGSAMNPEAFMAAGDQFAYLQGAGFDRTLLSFLEVAADGSVNVSRLSARPHITAGAGGFIDITSHARHIVFGGYFTAGGLDTAVEDGALRILREGRIRKFVPRVEQVTFSGPRAVAQGQDVWYVTERCVLHLQPEGLTVVEIAPGVDVDRDVLGQSDVPLRVAADLRAMDPRLFDPAPMELRLRPGAAARQVAAVSSAGMVHK